MNNTISACLTVCHEEECIRRSLESIKDVVDEIVVVHDGPCSDKTLDIAREYTSKVFVHDKRGNAELIRYYSFNQASQDWIFIIDADEALSFALQKKIRNLVCDPDIDGYIFQWPYYDNNGKIIKRSLFKKKFVLIRKNKFYHVGLPHMVGDSYSKKNKKVDLQLKHFYRKEEENRFFSDIKKDLKRAKITAELYLRPEKIMTYNCNIFFNNYPFYKKIILFTKQPIRALFIYPIYKFYRIYFISRFYREGVTGFLQALHMPIYYFLSSFYFVKLKYFKDKKNQN